MTEEEPPKHSADPAFKALDARIREARLKEEQRSPVESEHGTSPVGMALGMRIGIELVSALAVSGGIGWYLDRWLETKPWLMLAMLVLGSAAGLMNAYRAAMKANAQLEAGLKEDGDHDPQVKE